ncbi:hypothetical protein [Gloeocapsopsis sp. IPPAS B-1203]|uniref:hypothetical protein n=1 Tax=Gloeocapsopsis sp. IPPAS B-1203 TaxID=2049454 RepID=UPI000C19F5E0|nr:hypothetical protein [Gloeocapsopsis sp. IPPAS B-1203]PIG94347.1 hypothetical protein CSQ79_03350 [Gloeocapsopsis sp. IPPAS B-1203]
MKSIIIALLMILLAPTTNYAQTHTLEVEPEQKLRYQLELLRLQRNFEATCEQQRQEANQDIQRVLTTSREVRDSSLHQTAAQEWQQQQEAQRDITNRTIPRFNR